MPILAKPHRHNENDIEGNEMSNFGGDYFLMQLYNHLRHVYIMYSFGCAW